MTFRQLGFNAAYAFTTLLKQTVEAVQYKLYQFEFGRKPRTLEETLQELGIPVHNVSHFGDSPLLDAPEAKEDFMNKKKGGLN